MGVKHCFHGDSESGDDNLIWLEMGMKYGSHDDDESGDDFLIWLEPGMKHCSHDDSVSGNDDIVWLGIGVKHYSHDDNENGNDNHGCHEWEGSIALTMLAKVVMAMSPDSEMVSKHCSHEDDESCGTYLI